MRLLCLPLLALIVSVGCVSPMILANSAGYMSGVGYLVVNDPPQEEVAKVKDVLLKVDTAVDKLKPDEMLSVLYPDIAAEINAEFSGVTKTLALSITRMVLDGIDTFFLSNPDAVDERDLAILVTRAYTRGARNAFDQFATDAAMKAKLATVKSASAEASATPRNNN